jgi:hypothetical protein
VLHGLHGKKKYAALLHKEGCPKLHSWSCNPLNFTVLKPSDWTWGYAIGIGINEKGLNPGTLMPLKVVTVIHKSSSYQVFHSFYEKMSSNFSISAEAKNFFLSLAESIAQTLKVTSCYIFGGTNMEEY